MASLNPDTQTWHNIIMRSFELPKGWPDSKATSYSSRDTYFSFDTKSETGWDCSHYTDGGLWMVTPIGRMNQYISYTDNHFRLRLLAGNWRCVVGDVCAAPTTTETAGRFRSSSSLTLSCALDHHAVRCPCTLPRPRTNRCSLFCLLCSCELGASWDGFILWAPPWR